MEIVEVSRIGNTSAPVIQRQRFPLQSTILNQLDVGEAPSPLLGPPSVRLGSEILESKRGAGYRATSNPRFSRSAFRRGIWSRKNERRRRKEKRGGGRSGSRGTETGRRRRRRRKKRKKRGGARRRKGLELRLRWKRDSRWSWNRSIRSSRPTAAVAAAGALRYIEAATEKSGTALLRIEATH